MTELPLSPPPYSNSNGTGGRNRTQQQPKKSIADSWMNQLRRNHENQTKSTSGRNGTNTSGGGGSTTGTTAGGSRRLVTPPASVMGGGNGLSTLNLSPLSNPSSRPSRPSHPSVSAVAPPSSASTLSRQQLYNAFTRNDDSSHPLSLSPPPHQNSSHSSRPATSSSRPTSSSTMNTATVMSSHRHREAPERIYAEPKYDAEFDRGAGSSRPLLPTTTTTSTTTASSHQQQQSRLFNPERPNSLPVVRYSETTTTSSSSRRGDTTTTRPVRSKRDVVDPVDLGLQKKGRESKESVASEDSGRPGSTRSSKEGRHRRKKEEGVRSSGRRGETGGGVEERGAVGQGTGSMAGTIVLSGAGGGSTTLAGNANATTTTTTPRQLFDPRRDDPVRFAPSTTANGTTRSKKHSTPSLLSVTSLSSTSDLAPSPSSRSNPNALSNEFDDVNTASTSNGRQDPNSFVVQLKRAYREITDLETKLNDEHRAASNAALREEEERGEGIRIQGGRKKHDDDYWVRLANGHKQLADAHYSFLQMALDPRLPTSLHSLPQKYNIPVRLWQTAFHQLLERMRHAITSAPAPTPTASVSATDATPMNVLEHLIEFIQYAYGHYSQLFEDPIVAVFRSSWIEQLGDLARYRMAVAGLASRVQAAETRGTVVRTSYIAPVVVVMARIDDDEAMREVNRMDAASIGDAALGDWELEEQETWRVMSRDWYGQGISETPGSGRLHHHLALLSKGDELRGLYHYSKSLTASHPYVSARESILPLFEDELQARRTQPDVSAVELFVHLHGMLFTKISLDDFDDGLERFLERLREETCLVERSRTKGGEGVTTRSAFTDAEWMMIAVINISALLQYGAEDGVLKKATSKETEVTATNHQQHQQQGSRRGTTVNKTPQAIMLNPSSLKRSEVVESEEGETGGGGDDHVKSLQGETKLEDPFVFRLAQRLSFTILDILLQQSPRLVNDPQSQSINNPYVVLLLTFLAHMAQHPAALRHLERAIPWTRLTALFNSIPNSVEMKYDGGIVKISGSPLPEDWCVRGMEWTGKHLFGRGHWRSKMNAGGGGGGRDEMMMPPPIVGPSNSGVESEMEALRFDLDLIDEGAQDEYLPSRDLAMGRWRRIAGSAMMLVRTVAGLDYDQHSGGRHPRFVVVGHLEAKLRRWKAEEVEAAELDRLSKESIWARSRESGPSDDESEESDDDDTEEEEEGDESESEDVKELKLRRRQLKSIIRQARLATKQQQSTTSKQSSIRRISGGVKSSRQTSRSVAAAATIKVFAGYTVLVFDTNILLSPMKLFQALVEAKSWTIVVPLAVITELDGLKRNPAPLGTAALAALSYLESTIITHSTYLKVPTSKGNFLRDINLRFEDLVFSSDTSFSHDFARNMDDVILQAAARLKSTFVSRLAIVNPLADKSKITKETAQVVLVTFDRNLRLKARARGIDGVDEKGMAKLLKQEKG